MTVSWLVVVLGFGVVCVNVFGFCCLHPMFSFFPQPPTYALSSSLLIVANVRAPVEFFLSSLTPRVCWIVLLRNFFSLNRQLDFLLFCRANGKRGGSCLCLVDSDNPLFGPTVDGVQSCLHPVDHCSGVSHTLNGDSSAN